MFKQHVLFITIDVVSRLDCMTADYSRNSIIICYLIILNADASLVENKSRDRHYKRILLLLRAHGCKYECKRCIFCHIACRSYAWKVE